MHRQFFYLALALPDLLFLRHSSISRVAGDHNHTSQQSRPIRPFSRLKTNIYFFDPLVGLVLLVQQLNVRIHHDERGPSTDAERL